jgi:hypothetical protein
MADEKVLVVDEAVERLLLLHNYLTPQDYDVRVASNTETVLQLLDGQDLNVVLTARRMRGMDGLGAGTGDAYRPPGHARHMSCFRSFAPGPWREYPMCTHYQHVDVPNGVLPREPLGHRRCTAYAGGGKHPP